ncbi:MspA family porin [Gordonia tangerina]|uniref:MspA family porin n=1 Tax=Gordonia tangerina TaxID=2911060 RepID=UPI003EE0CC6E
MTRAFDGWTVRLVKFDEEVHSVPALNQSPWTREGFLSLGGRLEISGTGKSPVTAAALSEPHWVWWRLWSFDFNQGLGALLGSVEPPFELGGREVVEVAV